MRSARHRLLRRCSAFSAFLLVGWGAVSWATPRIPPVLLRVAVFEPPRTDLAVHDVARPAREVVDLRAHVVPEERGVFIGPIFIPGSQARGVRKALSTLPRSMQKSVTGAVGPWGMTANDAIGRSVGGGVGMFARF